MYTYNISIYKYIKYIHTESILNKKYFFIDKKLY